MSTKEEIRDQRHADMINRFVKYYSSQGYEIHGIEVPYYYPGGREGYIDVVMSKDNSLFVCELKPYIFDIGHSLREVNGAEQYFLKARKEFGNFQQVFYTLELEPTEDNLEILMDNKEQYKMIQVRFFEEEYPEYPSYMLRWQKFLEGDMSLEISQEPVLIGYLCVICRNELPEEAVLCEKCAEMMNPWYPSLMRTSNKLDPQYFIAMNPEYLKKE